MDNKKPDIEKDESVCYIPTIQSAFPDNVTTAQVLIIGESCLAVDVYAIICDRRNFKTVKVGPGKCTYTVQEIRNMSVHERVGHVKAQEDDIPDDVWRIEGPINPAPPTQRTTFTIPGFQEAYQGLWLGHVPIPRPTLAEINRQGTWINDLSHYEITTADTYTPL